MIDAFHLNQAAAFRAQGQLAQAATSYAEAVRLNPRNPQSLVDYGTVLGQLGRDEEAQAAFASALTQAPKRADACILRGNALYRLGRFDEALAMQNRALRLAPDFAPIHFNRGNALLRLRRNDEALAAFERALALEPDFTDALANKGAALQALRRYEEAIAVQDRVEALNPGQANTVSNRGFSYLELGRYDEAAADLIEAMRRARGDHPASQLSLGFISMIRGDYATGWDLMETRGLMAESYGSTPYYLPEFRDRHADTAWTGAQNLAGKTLMVHAEQGLGDVLQFCRYLPLVRARGARVVFVCHNLLMRLVSSVDPAIEIQGFDQPLPQFDYHIPLLSLPRVLGTRLDSIPASTPYLTAEPERVAAWRARLGDHGYRIGVTWRGSAMSAEQGRTFPLALLKDLAALPGVRLISLQAGQGREELKSLPRGMAVEALGKDFDAGADAFLDTAAVMQSLDLIITPDTAIAHLAGALGCRTWVALKHAPDWRWLLGRSDSPWYPGMKLFRQRAVRDWSGVFSAMEQELAAELAQRGVSSAP